MLARSRTVNATTYLFAVVLLLSLFFLSLPSMSPGSGTAMAEPGSGWEDQSKNYFTSSRTSVSAVDGSTAWVVGYGGIILKTTDGGSSWARQPSGTAAGLSGVTAVDASTAWVVSSTGLIMKTSDGGSTWNVQKTGAGVLSAVHAVDAHNAWAVGSEFGTLMNRMIWKTEDGGNTWIRKGPTGGMGLTGISSPHANIAWGVGPQENPFAAGGVLVKTSDGGDTWVSQGTEVPSLLAVCAVDTSIVWASGYQGSVIKTTNGGETWTPIRTGTETLESISAVDGATAWAVGQSGTILKTSNGGADWAAQGSVGADLASVHAVNADTAWTVGSGGIILKTTDGGSSWPEKIDTSLGITSDLNAVAAVSDDVAWAAGAGVLLRSTDGGVNWDVIYASSSISINDICALDASNLWAVGNTGDGGFIYRTTDGGSNWSLQYYSAGTSITGISAADALTAWAVGTGGIILKTSDGGSTWTPQGSGTTRAITSICAIDGETAWATSLSAGFSPYWGYNAYYRFPPYDSAPYDPIILRTTDGGNNWTHNQIGTWNEYMNDIAAAGRSNAIAVGADIVYSPIPLFDITAGQLGYLYLLALSTNGILVTNDGGTSWLPQATNVPVSLTAVDMVDAATAWVVGTAGTIARTGDGGHTWTPQVSGVGIVLNDISAVDACTAWAVGTGGTILKTGDGGDARPDIASISPHYGDIGSSVTIAGCDFGANRDSSSVFFGSIQASEYVSWSDGEVVVIVPPGAIGEIKVKVITAAGNSNEVDFEGPYESPAPAITSVNPNIAAQFTWAADLQVAGTGFVPGAAVRLEKGAAVLNAYNVSVVSGEQINCTAGLFGAEPGNYDVVVTNPDGQEARLPGAFTVASACGAGSSTALLMLGLTLGLLTLAGTAGWRKRRKR